MKIVLIYLKITIDTIGKKQYNDISIIVNFDHEAKQKNKKCSNQPQERTKL